MFAQNAINRHPTDVQAPPNHANHDNLPGSHNGVGQDMNARVPYHQPTLATIGASHEPEDFVFVRAAASERRQDVDDDEPSSRSKMWDPVKECSDPNTIQADLPGFLPGGHSYSQAQDNRQQSMNSRTRGTAPIGLPPYPQPHDLAFAYSESALAGSQMFQNGHPYDQFHRNKYLYKDIMISPRRLGDSSGQNGQQSLESMTGEAALLRIQPQQAGYLHGLFQDNGQQLLGLGSRMPNSLVPHESAHSRPSSPSMSSNISTQRRADSQQAYGLQRQSPSASMSPAKRMGRYAEALDRESNHTEAVRAYEQACALFQEVIIRSCSLEERMECDTAVGQ